MSFTKCIVLILHLFKIELLYFFSQFWVSYVPCESQPLNAVQLTIEQIDLIKRLIEEYSEDLQIATTADGK